MVSTKKFMELMKKKIEADYPDTATVSTMVKSKDPISKQSDVRETVLLTDIPCRLSYLVKGSGPSVKTDTYDISSNIVKLFLAPEHDIPIGSRITVHHQGEHVRYECAGIPKKYPTHQEIEMLLDGAN